MSHHPGYQTEIRLTFTTQSRPILDAMRRYQENKMHRSLAEAARCLLKEALINNGYVFLPEEQLPKGVSICSNCHSHVRGELVFDGKFRQFTCLCRTKWLTPVEDE